MHIVPAMPAEPEQSAQGSKSQEQQEQRDQAAQKAETWKPKEGHPILHTVMLEGYLGYFTRWSLSVKGQAAHHPSIVGKYAETDDHTEQYQR